MFSAGMLTALASSIALRRRGFDSGEPPPSRADIVISRISFVKRRPRFASAAPFLCLIVLHLLWTDMRSPRSESSPTGTAVIVRDVGGRARHPAARNLVKPPFSLVFTRPMPYH